MTSKQQIKDMLTGPEGFNISFEWLSIQRVEDECGDEPTIYIIRMDDYGIDCGLHDNWEFKEKDIDKAIDKFLELREEWSEGYDFSEDDRGV